MNKLKALSILALTSLILVGCESSTTTNYTDSVALSSRSTGLEVQEFAYETDSLAYTSDNIIKEANISIETVNYTEDKKLIEDIIKSNNVKVMSLNESTGTVFQPYGTLESNKSYYNANYTVKIDSNNLEGFVEELSKVGHVLNKNIGSEDVTETVTDLESRIETLDARIAKLTELLEQAETMEDVITLEERIDDAIASKEELLGEQGDIQNKINESTVYIYLNEVAILQDGYTQNESFTGRIADAFTQSWGRFKLLTQEIIVSLVLNLPIIIVVLALIGLVGYLRRFIRNRKITKQNKDNQNDKSQTK